MVSNGEALKRCREAKGWSQAELAKRAEISKRVLQNLEQGVRDVNKMALDTALRLADTLGVDVRDIMN